MAVASLSPTTSLGTLFEEETFFPGRAATYPEFRYMGSKSKLLPWIHSVLSQLPFHTSSDPFCGSGSVSYLLKSMGKQVHSSDSLNFPTVIAKALVENSETRVPRELSEEIAAPGEPTWRFIQETFGGIFFRREDLLFLDLVHERASRLENPSQHALVMTALIRSCMKRQPRGVFTVGNREDGSPRYDDGRRDIRLSLREHFLEQMALLDHLVFSNGLRCEADRKDALLDTHPTVDLVYLDPPYVPRSDDNCYMKRYHFLEGLSYYWRGAKLLETSKVRKIEKPRTPFGSRSTALDAFDRLFRSYADSTIVLSYSSNGYPDREILESILRRYKPVVEVFERPHRYHFGTHRRVERAETTEYLFVGTV
jgi:adenine-specific DNA-methyltransferase